LVATIAEEVQNAPLLGLENLDEFHRNSGNVRACELRLARNMSLADLANAAGLSKGHLSSVEHGLASITVETIAHIAKGLGLPAM
jgi:predicted transcriptional regulator